MTAVNAATVTRGEPRVHPSSTAVPRRIGRRALLTLLGGATMAAAGFPLRTGRAQTQPRPLRIGYVGIDARDSPRYRAFLQRMAELGYQEGRNLVFEYVRTPTIDSYAQSYRELAARKVDVFLSVGNEPALLAAREAAQGKPIVFLAIDFDPLAKGYVASLQRPGGNITGIFVRQLELAAKRVEIAHELLPHAGAVAIAFDRVSREQRDAALEAARRLGLEPRAVDLDDDPERALALSDAPSIVLPASPNVLLQREAIARILLERGIASIAAYRENTQAGALISYGFDLTGLFRDIAGHVQRVAAGARPADTPIEHSQRFQTVINLVTARALGLVLPDSFVARADHVIE